MANTRTNRFAFPAGSTTGSLRRLRTAFSPTRSNRSVSPSSTATTSPLTRASSPDSHRSSASINSIRNLLMLRRKPSVLDIELEEERHLFGHELEMLEPRPSLGGLGGVEVGIFEVLEGRC